MNVAKENNVYKKSPSVLKCK